MNIDEFLEEIKPESKWWDRVGLWYCTGCGQRMDKPESELHWPKNCSLKKIPFLKKLRATVLSAYEKANSDPSKLIKKSSTSHEVGLDWYANQIENSPKLPIDLIGEPSGAETDPNSEIRIKLRELTAEDLIPKLCRKCGVITGDPIIDSIPMADEPFRDLDNNIIDTRSEEIKEYERNLKFDYTVYYTPEDIESMKDSVVKAKSDQERDEWLNKWNKKKKGDLK